MKTLLKKMRTLTTCIVLLFSVLCNGQVGNEIIYTDIFKGTSGYYADTLSFDIDEMVDAGYLNLKLADTIGSLWVNPNIIDTTVNYYITSYECGVRWSVAEAKQLSYGDWTGIDSSKRAFYHLMTKTSLKTHIKPKYECLLRMYKKIDGAMANKVDSLCIGKIYGSNPAKFYIGYLRPEMSAANNVAYLTKDTLSGDNIKMVEYNTVADKDNDNLLQYFHYANNK